MQASPAGRVVEHPDRLQIRFALKKLLEQRHVGAGRAATGQELVDELAGAGYLGIHLRRISEAVSALRESGLVIASSSGAPAGYFVVSTPLEAKACLDELDGRLAALHRTRNRMVNELKRSTNPQLALFGESR